MSKNDDDEMKSKSSELARFEQERLNRRSALRKIGIRSGAVFGMFFMADDLARFVADKLARYKNNSLVAETVARDFRNMGVAFAFPGSSDPSCTPQAIGNGCQEPTFGGYVDCTTCFEAACYRCYNDWTNLAVHTAYGSCVNSAINYC